MTMYKCPSCGEATISWWKKLWATRLSPVKCKACGKRCYVPIKYGWAVYIYLALPAILAWALVFIFQSGWPFLIFVVAIPWAVKRSILSGKLLAK